MVPFVGIKLIDMIWSLAFDLRQDDEKAAGDVLGLPESSTYPEYACGLASPAALPIGLLIIHGRIDRRDNERANKTALTML